MWKKQCSLALLILLFFTLVSTADLNESNRINDRLKIIRSLENHKLQNIKVLEELLNDSDPVIRRTSARILIEHFSGNKEKLENIYNNSDSIVSRTALQKIFDTIPEQSLIFAEDTLKFKEDIVRNTAISNLVSRKPYNSKTIELIKLAQSDKNFMVKKAAVDALWPFHTDKVPIRERKDYDHEVVVKSTIQIPKDKWLFRTDPNQEGHYKNWFAPEVNAYGWGAIDIESDWQKQNYNYYGAAWYRKSVELPEKPVHASVELRFDGVQESAYIWVNGKYVGSYDKGALDWDQPFSVDITDEVKWSQKNTIAVRVISSARKASGILKPVRIEILK
jgi:hypothetical protein